MSRPTSFLILAVLLALCTVLGVVTPASAAQNMPAPVAAMSATADARTTEPATEDATTLDAPAAAVAGERWIEVIVSQRRLIAREGNKVVYSSIVSVGKPSTPTIRGTFRIYAKLRSTRMSGPGYNLPNVPHTMYFRGGYAIHGAYWVKRFGTAISRGCVNVNLRDAAWLFKWAPVGTRVVVR